MPRGQSGSPSRRSSIAKAGSGSAPARAPSRDGKSIASVPLEAQSQATQTPPSAGSVSAQMRPRAKTLHCRSCFACVLAAVLPQAAQRISDTLAATTTSPDRGATRSSGVSENALPICSLRVQATETASAPARSRRALTTTSPRLFTATTSNSKPACGPSVSAAASSATTSPFVSSRRKAGRPERWPNVSPQQESGVNSTTDALRLACDPHAVTATLAPAQGTTVRWVSLSAHVCGASQSHAWPHMWSGTHAVQRRRHAPAATRRRQVYDGQATATEHADVTPGGWS